MMHTPDEVTVRRVLDTQSYWLEDRVYRVCSVEEFPLSELAQGYEDDYSWIDRVFEVTIEVEGGILSREIVALPKQEFMRVVSYRIEKAITTSTTPDGSLLRRDLEVPLYRMFAQQFPLSERLRRE